MALLRSCSIITLTLYSYLLLFFSLSTADWTFPSFSSIAYSGPINTIPASFSSSFITHNHPSIFADPVTNTAMASSTSVLLFVPFLLIISSFMVASAGNFNQDFKVTWGDGRAKILNDGKLLTLSLDKASGSGFESTHEYLFGKIVMQLKLVAGNSAGTVTAYYVRLRLYLFACNWFLRELRWSVGFIMFP